MARTGIDFGDSEPAYRQLAGIVRDQILSGEIPPRRAIPTSRYLCETYGVGKGTVVRAMSLLKDEGLIEAVHGRGFFAAERER
jgi:DNA-binding GntR family transcriptional regulator